MPLSNLNTTDWAPMPLLNYATIQGVANFPMPTTYEAARNFLIKIVENAALYNSFLNGIPTNLDVIHDDSLGIPTIGYGFNLMRADLAATEIVDLFNHVYGGVLTVDQTNAVDLVRKWRAAEQLDLTTIDPITGLPISASIIVTNMDIIDGAQGNAVSLLAHLQPGHGLSAAQIALLQVELDQEMQTLEDLSLNEAQANTLLDADFSGLGGILDSREQALDATIGANTLPNSIERVAIMSAFYNAPSLVGPGLTGALNADARAIA